MTLKNLFWVGVGVAILRGLNDTSQNETIGKIKLKSKFMPPYKNFGDKDLGWRTETNFAWAQNRTGFYIIKENGKTVYVGAGRNVYKCAMRHFQPAETGQNNKQRYYDSYFKNDYTLRIVLTNTSQQAFRFEQALISKLKPRDNYIFTDIEFEPAAQNEIDTSYQQYFKRLVDSVKDEDLPF